MFLEKGKLREFVHLKPYIKGKTKKSSLDRRKMTHNIKREITEEHKRINKHIQKYK